MILVLALAAAVAVVVITAPPPSKPPCESGAWQERWDEPGPYKEVCMKIDPVSGRLY